MQWYNVPSTQQGLDITLTPQSVDMLPERSVVAKRPARGDEAEEDHGWDEEDGGRRPR
jgi:hypothetical protein